MRSFGFRRLAPLLALAVSGLTASPYAFAQSDATPPDQQLPTVSEGIQVTATRLPEDVEVVPASITILKGDDLAARGATDLTSALALVAGVSAVPGGDGGPAGSVPQFWGLREFDAFLLVVDGVPWGGAFNPALNHLDFTNLDRIEIVRGAAPVLYGATSFVGVIHVIHRAAGAPGRSVRVYGGNYSSGGADVSLALPQSGAWKQSLSASIEKRGFKDDHTGVDRGHLLYRGAADLGGGQFRLDFDGSTVRQDPASPHPREGPALTTLVPLDANHNPRGAKIDEDRLHLVGGYDRTLAGGSWSTTLSFTHSTRDSLRGFLVDLSNTDPNSHGFRQDLTVDDVYFDSHVAWKAGTALQLVFGLDHLYGKAKADSGDFDYFASLDGKNVDSGSSHPSEGAFDLDDERNFTGLYGQAEWSPTPTVRIDIGLRLNRTVEDREASEHELADPEEGEEGSDKLTTTRGTGSLGINWQAWSAGDSAVWLYADYRNSFKPAAIDFGPEAEPEILKPETAKSYEAGAKGRFLGGKVDADFSVFQLDFRNLVLSQLVNGSPKLINAGGERLKGAELEVGVEVADDLKWQVAVSYHDAVFTDFLREFDGSPRQLRGNRLELSPKEEGRTGLIYAPASGLQAWGLLSYVGDQFLNQRNTALQKSYTTWAAGIGYRFAKGSIVLDGQNLSDERPPVAESELGDAQYYRLPARSVRLSWTSQF